MKRFCIASAIALIPGSAFAEMSNPEILKEFARRIEALNYWCPQATDWGPGRNRNTPNRVFARVTCAENGKRAVYDVELNLREDRVYAREVLERR